MPDPSLQHISLTCDDPIAVKQFYKKHPGFRRARVVDLGHCSAPLSQNPLKPGRTTVTAGQGNDSSILADSIAVSL